MNIYITKKINSISLFGDSVVFPFDPPIVKHSMGLSYVIACLSNGITDVDSISIELKNKFNLVQDLAEVRESILSNTLEDKKIRNAFTLDIAEANSFPTVYGEFGKRYPQILHIELTGSCNYACSHCYKNATYTGNYIEYDYLKNNIYNQFKGKIPVIHFTGGEPTLHKDFCKLVNLFNDGYELQLSTNGSKIISFPLDVFKKFQAIDISLYGLNSAEYGVNTGNAMAYLHVRQACEMLSASNIDFRITTVINNSNWRDMEAYVRFAIDVGAGSINFGMPTISGKLYDTPSDKWILTKETRKDIYRKFRYIQNKYHKRIYITNWERSRYSSMWQSYPNNDSLRCGAGRNSWWLSENHHFRPCSFLPDEYMNLDYDTWYSYITNEQELDWSNARNSLELFASNHDLDITDLCPIFRK